MLGKVKAIDVDSAALQSERGFTRTVIAYAQSQGWRVAHFRPGRTAQGWRTAVQGDGKGFPDLVLVRGKDLWFVELKMRLVRVSEAQREWLWAVRGAGVVCLLWTPKDWPEIMQVLKKEGGE